VRALLQRDEKTRPADRARRGSRPLLRAGSGDDGRSRRRGLARHPISPTGARCGWTLLRTRPLR